MMAGLLVHHSVRAISARSPAITWSVFEICSMIMNDNNDDDEPKCTK